jgi:hypothetical protein
MGTKTILISFLLVILAGVALAGSESILKAPMGFPHVGGGGSASSTFDMGSYHTGASLFCSQCHVMHASESHAGASGVPDPFGPFPRTFTPTANLLKAADPVTLCLTCHDNEAGIPDVVGTDVNGLSNRSAGFFAAIGADNHNGHKIATGVDATPGWNGLCSRCHVGSSFQDPGPFSSAAVSCIDCHNPHGNKRARNLQWASDPGNERPFGYYIRPGATGMARYETDNIGFPAPLSNEYRELSNMCKDCHHVMSGQLYVDVDDDGIHEKHPAYDSEYGSNGTNRISQGDVKGSTVSAHWVGGTGGGFLHTPRLRYLSRGATDFASSRTVSANNGVFCLTCHKAHGSDQSFSLTWDPSFNNGGGEGCDQCHNKTDQ